MTIPAVDAVVSNVMFVTELYGLLALDPLSGIPGRAVELSSHPERSYQDKQSAIDRNFCERVCAVMEDLRHATSSAERSKTTSEGETAGMGQGTNHQGKICVARTVF